MAHEHVVDTRPSFPPPPQKAWGQGYPKNPNQACTLGVNSRVCGEEGGGECRFLYARHCFFCIIVGTVQAITPPKEAFRK